MSVVLDAGNATIAAPFESGLDFVDLLLRARDLVRDEAAVRADFQERFTHIFVD